MGHPTSGEQCPSGHGLSRTPGSQAVCRDPIAFRLRRARQCRERNSTRQKALNRDGSRLPVQANSLHGTFTWNLASQFLAALVRSKTTALSTKALPDSCVLSLGIRVDMLGTKSRSTSRVPRGRRNAAAAAFWLPPRLGLPQRGEAHARILDGDPHAATQTAF